MFLQHAVHQEHTTVFQGACCHLFIQRGRFSFRAFVVYDHTNFDLALFVANSTLLSCLRQYVIAKIIVSFSRRMSCDEFVRQNTIITFHKIQT